MKGYVKNIGKAPIYVLKNVVGCNEIINFDVLVERFGDVADTSSAKTFANWLSKNKFVDKTTWKVVVGKENTQKKKVEDLEETVSDDEAKDEKEEAESISKVTATNREIIRKVVTGVSREMTADDVATMSVSEMKRNLPKIDDIKLLKMALNKAESMTQKATLCNGLRDRITQLSV